MTMLNRYTSLPVVIDMLARKRITLLSPALWEDRNDAYYLERYKEVGGYSSVLAICFSQKGETCHHWQVFSNGLSGVRIEFDKDALLSAVADLSGFSVGDVQYRLIRTVKKSKPPIIDWPFLKRKPYTNEGEFRIVYASKKDSAPVKHVSIDLSCVHRVTLSPWLPESIAESVKGCLRVIDGCKRIKINRSSLIENTSWKEAIK